MSSSGRQVLGRQITIRLALFATLIFILGLAATVVHEKYRAQENRKQQIDTLINLSRDAVAVALWNYDLRQLKALGDLFFFMPGVSYVHIRDNYNNTLYSRGTTSDSTQTSRQLTSYYHDRTSELAGQAQVEWHLPDLPSVIRDSLSPSIVRGFAVIFASVLVFVWLIRKYVLTPVEAITSFVRDTSGDRRSRLVLPGQRTQTNEMDTLADTINHFLDTIDSERSARQGAEHAVSQVAQQLENLGRVTAAQSVATLIAHEINQPLGAAMMNAESALSLVKASAAPAIPGLSETLEDLMQQTRRASDVVIGIRNTVKQSRGEVNYIDINQLVSDTVSLFQHDKPPSLCPIHLNLGSTPFYVLTSPTHMSQVLLNLLNNACEAIQSCAQDDGCIDIQIAPINDQLLQITVMDNGPGLPDELLSHGIKPGHSSKSGGLGIGLMITQLLLEWSGGSLQFSNNTERGATFTVTLPYFLKAKTV